MNQLILATGLPLLAASLAPPIPDAIVPCDLARLEAHFADTATGQRARAFAWPSAQVRRALVAIDPLGPPWAGYLLLTACDSRVLDRLQTGSIDSIRRQNVTGRDRPEAIVYALAATGTGTRTYMITIVAVVDDSLHRLWSRPSLESFFESTWGGQDSATVTFPGSGWLRYEGISQALDVDTAQHGYVPSGPPCAFGGRWHWRAEVDSFEPVPPVIEARQCRAA